MLLALLGGVTLGAIAVALTTPKTGKEVRDRLRALGRRFRAQAELAEMSDEDAVAMFI